MFIEIKGTQFINKGAELMLYAILNKINENYDNVKIVHEPKYSPYLKRAELGLFQKIWFPKNIFPLGLNSGKLIPKVIRKSFGLITHQEIQVVLDASGFTYSSQCGHHSSIIMAKACKQWKKIGTKIILLPQAFGPFKTSTIRKAFKTVVELSDLIYARDIISYKNIIELTGEKDKIKISPDFTILVKGILPEYFLTKNDYYCVIPNYRMIDKTSTKISNNYIKFLVNCVELLIENKKKVFFLIHEGKDDLLLAQEVIKNFDTNQKIEIIQETNPLKIKGIIGNCKGVIGSRFHGLVSSLSQGIPTLCAGWSHKYEMLFDDYNYKEGLITVNLTKQELKSKIDLITISEYRKGIINKLLKESNKQKLLVENMWNEILKMLNN